jgi:TFIIS helical bundle-like domain
LVEPLPDKALPLLHKRKHILQLLFDLKITREHLMKSKKIKVIVVTLQGHKSESSENKVLIRELTNKWKNLLMYKTTDYTMIHEIEQMN